MTLAMPDSVTVADLPPGYPAYLGYADGRYANAAQLIARFPAARHVLLTVTGRMLNATGCDVEPGNMTADQAAGWVAAKLAGPGVRPVVYASVLGDKPFTYGMPGVLDALQAAGIHRASVRLLSAHYGQGEHICGPDTCKLISVPVDGTQWTNSFFAGNERFVDMSVLRDDFFNPSSSQTEAIVRELPIVRQGDSGDAVRTVQALCNARELDLSPSGPKVVPLKLDGVFGEMTKASVVWFQTHADIAVDGVVGPQTWPVLLGIAP